MSFIKSLSFWYNCANPACKSARMATRLVCSGAYLDGQRFCSPDCLQTGLDSHLSELIMRPMRATIRRQHRIPLGLTLVSRGDIDTATLRAALLQQKKDPSRRLGQILIQMSAVSEGQVTNAVASQWSVPVFKLNPDKVPPAALQIPFYLMERYRMIPVHFNKEGKRLHLAFAQTVDHSVLYSIEKMLGVHTESCIADESVITRLISLAGQDERPAEYVLKSMTQRELVSMLAGYAIRLHAERVTATRCHDQIWARTVGKGETATHFMFSAPETAENPSSFEVERHAIS
jgi:hypothetical protein